MAERHSEEDQPYLDQVVEEAAEKARPHVGDERKIDQIVQEIGTHYLEHTDLMRKYRRQVKRRLKEMWAGAKNEQEKHVVEEFDGYVKVVDGRYQPTGISEDFKVRVRPGVNLRWRDHFRNIAYIWDGVIGKTIDSKGFHKLIDDTEKARTEIEELQQDLDLLQDSRQSTKELLALGGSGFMGRIRQSGRGFFGSVAGGFDDILEGYRENKDMKIEMKQKAKLLKKLTRKQERREYIRDAMLEKIESTRDQSRELFQKAFQKQVDALLAQKDRPDFDRKKKALKAKVSTWARRTGFPHMDVYFQEAMGEGVKADEEVTELEAKRRATLVSRFIKGITGSAPDSGMAEEVMDILKEKDPEVLHSIYKNKYSFKGRLVLTFLCKKIKPKSRRMKPDAQLFARYLMYGMEYEEIPTGELDAALTEFADNWRGLKAEDFDEVIDDILEGKAPTKKEKKTAKEQRAEKKAKKKLKKEKKATAREKKKAEMKALKEEKEATEKEVQQVSAFYADVTGEQLPRKESEELLESLQSDEPLKSRYKKRLKSNTHMQLLRVFFQGYATNDQEVWVEDNTRLPRVTVDNFFELFKRVDEISHKVTRNLSQWYPIVQEYLLDDAYRYDDLLGLTVPVFEAIRSDLSTDKEAEKAKRDEELADRVREEEQKRAREAMEQAGKLFEEEHSKAMEKIQELTEKLEKIETEREETEAKRIREEEDKKLADKIRSEERAKADKKRETLLAELARLKEIVRKGLDPASSAPSVSGDAPTRAPSRSSDDEPVDTAAREAREAERRSLVRQIMSIPQKDAHRVVQELLRDKDFEWETAEEYKEELRFLFTGRYRLPDGTKKELLSPKGRWGLYSAHAGNLRKFLRHKDALKRMKESLPAMYNEAGYHESTRDFFEEYVLKGNRRVEPKKAAKGASKKAASSPDDGSSGDSSAPKSSPDDTTSAAPTDPVAARNVEYDKLSPEQKLVADTFLLQKDVNQAKRVHEIIELTEGLMETIQKEKVQKMVAFFLTAKIDDIDLIKQADKPKAVKKKTAYKRNETNLNGLIEILPVLDSLSVDQFKKEVRDFFTSADKTMKNFLKHIRETYLSSTR